jgi:hypothetical protein
MTDEIGVMYLKTVWAHTVAKLCLWAVGDVSFHLLPGIFLFANLLAETAYGQDPSQEGDLSQ